MTNENLETKASTTQPDADPPRRGIRVRTMVFGLVMLAISTVVLLSTLTSVHLDFGVIALIVLVGAGAALVTGGVASAMREARDGTLR